MKLLLTLAWVATTSSSLLAAPVDSDDFPPSRARIAPVDGADATVIDDTADRFEDVRVRPDTKYTLSLDASFSGEVESIEENSRFEIFTRLGHISPVLPSRKLQFLNAAGQPLDSPLQHAMPFRERHSYIDVFYTPASAASLRLHVASGKGIQLSIHNLKVEETADEGAINTNPAFVLGPMNYSGWKNVSRGGQIIDRDGKTVFDTKYGSRSLSFPLQGPGTYALSAKARGNGYNSCVQVHVFDAKGTMLLKVSTRRYGPPSYFVPPKEAVTASFLVYSCLLEEVRLVRVGDENAIDTLPK